MKLLDAYFVSNGTCLTLKTKYPFKNQIFIILA